MYFIGDLIQNTNISKLCFCPLKAGINTAASGCVCVMSMGCL